MTLIHFVNCAALAYVPYYITYKTSGLSEYGAFWKCLNAAGVYAVVQLVKMLTLATFAVPGLIESDPSLLNYSLRYSVDVLDLVGLYLIISKTGGDGSYRCTVCGFGWAAAEAVLTLLLPLWVGARAPEFDWSYIMMSFDANLYLALFIGAARLVWIWSRHDLDVVHSTVVATLLVMVGFRSLLISSLKRMFTSVVAVSLQTVFSLSVALISYFIYKDLSRSSANSA